jgi:hypothetical protein
MEIAVHRFGASTPTSRVQRSAQPPAKKTAGLIEKETAEYHCEYFQRAVSFDLKDGQRFAWLISPFPI